MSARSTVGLGLGAIVVLVSVLVALRTHEPPREVVSAVVEEPGIVLGTSTRQIEGIDHIVEHYIAPPGPKTIDEQLGAIQVELHPEDEYTAIPDPSFGIGSKIEIVRATRVTITDAKQPTSYRTWLTSVGALLEAHNVLLDSDDRIDQSPESQLRYDLTITITRIGTKEVAEPEPVAFKQVTQKDTTLEKGTKKSKQVGKNGVRTKTYRITYEDGEQVSKNLIKNEITTDPIEDITLEGTKIITYGSGEATWYAWKPGGAAHNTLPFGTKVLVVAVASGKSTVVTINDRGIQGSAIIDLDKASFAAIAPLGAGRINVRLEKFYP
ncbi:MAG: G5 domain-containing protein [Patescibacteria group bacterium]